MTQVLTVNLAHLSKLNIINNKRFKFNFHKKSILKMTIEIVFLNK